MCIRTCADSSIVHYSRDLETTQMPILSTTDRRILYSNENTWLRPNIHGCTILTVNKRNIKNSIDTIIPFYKKRHIYWFRHAHEKPQFFKILRK